MTSGLETERAYSGLPLNKFVTYSLRDHIPTAAGLTRGWSYKKMPLKITRAAFVYAGWHALPVDQPTLSLKH